VNAHALPIAIVIASRNRPGLLGDTVTSIGSGDALPSEIVIVDQSDAGTPSPAWHVPNPVVLQHVRTATRGVSAGRNLGARAARTALIAFIDDDMRVEPQWLSALTKALTAAGPSAAVTGRVTDGGPEGEGTFVSATVNGASPVSYAGRINIDVLAGGNMAVYRDAFLRLGGFDERLGPGTRFPAAEDNDLGFRMLAAGLRIVYVPEAVLVHRAWRRTSSYVPLRFAYGHGKGGFYIKHLHLSDLHMARRLAWDLGRRAVRTVRSAAHPRRALGEMAYAAGVVTGACEWLIRRPADQADHQELATEPEFNSDAH